MAAGATNISVLDSNSTARAMRVVSSNGGRDGDLNPIVSLAGTVGVDHSVNAPALPNIGADFAGAGPYAGYVLVKTVAANAVRNCIEIANLTGAQIAVVRDDGTAADAAAPANGSVFALAGGAAAGQQGAGWTSTTFRGRLQIHAPAALAGSAYISVMED